MPHSQFYPEVWVIDGAVQVGGPLDPPDADTYEALVFACITQQPTRSRATAATAVTIRGEERLRPTPHPTATAGWTSRTRGARSAARRAAAAAAGGRDNWWFQTQLTAGDELRPGWAYGTAVLLELKTGGGVATYVWSEWVKVVFRSS
jgi:hypothetical protein